MATSTTARSSAAVQRGRLPEPVRDRRPALAALALLLVVGGALTSALVAYRSGDRIDVLVANRPIAVGEQVTQRDFRTARVAAEGALYVDSSAIGNFIGTRTTTAIPEGTLVNGSMFLRGSVVPDDAALIGVSLSAVQRPAAPLRSGDVVSVYAVVQDSMIATPLLSAVRVSDVRPPDSGGGVSLSLLVPAAQVRAVVASTTSSVITVVQLPSETQPLVDFVRE